MASSAVIGALRVNLSANTAAFDKGLRGADASLKRFGAGVARAAAAVAATMTVALGGLAVGMKRTIDQADKLSKMSQQIGIPTQELSALAHAADLSGVSLESTANGVGRLARNMKDAADGLKTPQRAFADLGINIKNADGDLKSMSEIMPEIADRFSKMEDGTEKTALAMVLLGRSGRELIPLLNAGSAGLNEMMQEAHALGIVIDTETGQAAERFNDNLTRLGRVKDGIITKLTAHMLPAFERLSQRLIDAAKNGQWVEKVARVLTGVMDGLTRAVMVVYENFGLLVQIMKVFVAAQVVKFIVSLAGALISLAKVIRTAGLALAAFNAIKRASLTTFVLLAGGIALATGQMDELEGAIDSLWSKVERIIPEDLKNAFTFPDIEGVDSAAAESLGKTWGAAEEAASSFGLAVDGAGKSIGNVVSATKAMSAQFVSSMEAAGDRMREVGQVVENSFMSAFDSAVDGTFKLRDAIGGLLKDLGRLLVNQAFTSLIGGAFGGMRPGYFSASLPGYATGGTFKVGGAGGIDSKTVAFRATPGEMVDIRKPGQDMGDGGIIFSPTTNIDAKGAGRGVAEEIKAALDVRDKNFETRLSALIQRQRTHGLV